MTGPYVQCQLSNNQRYRPLFRPRCASLNGFPVQRPHQHELLQDQQAFGHGSDSIHV